MGSKEECVAVQGDEEEAMKESPQEKLREKCKATKECARFGKKLSECNDRVNSRSKTAETCKEEVIDFMHCVDHCVAKKLFKYLK